MKGKTTTILLALVFILGFALLLYPTFSNYWNSFHQSRVVSNYEKAVESLSQKDYEETLRAAQAYNRGLLNNPNRFLDGNEEDPAYKNLLSLSDNQVMGYITIPKVNIRLPLYHGTSDAVLQVGVGHLVGSSLPVGGESAHAALSGHTGLPSASLLTDLDQLDMGDRFYLYVFGDQLVYQVDQILVVEPDEIDALDIIPGEDHVTLITCTPYGINTHRLLVRGVRTFPLSGQVHSEAEMFEFWMVTALFAAPLLLAGVLGLILLLVIQKRKKRAAGFAP